MRAILFDAPGTPDVLYEGDQPMPTPAEDELVVRVEATALNRVDLMQRQGRYPPPPGASPILGLELAGVVERAHAPWRNGDVVMGLLSGGGYAEYAALPSRLAMRIPAGLDMVRAAAIPEVFLTAYQALFLHGALQEGQTLLLHAGASGVGTAAIQLARHVGARVIVTASAPKHDLCLSLGAAEAIDYKSVDFADRTLAATGGAGADLIVDCIGAPYLARNVRSLAMDGCLVLISMMGGRKVPELDLRTLFRKRARVIATTLRNRSLPYKIDLTERFAAACLPLFADGRLRPVIDSVYDGAQARKAHERMEANRNAGKIVLRLGWGRQALAT